MWKEKWEGRKVCICEREGKQGKWGERLNSSMSYWFKGWFVPWREVMLQTEMFCLGHNSCFGCETLRQKTLIHLQTKISRFCSFGSVFLARTCPATKLPFDTSTLPPVRLQATLMKAWLSVWHRQTIYQICFLNNWTGLTITWRERMDAQAHPVLCTSITDGQSEFKTREWIQPLSATDRLACEMMY